MPNNALDDQWAFGIPSQRAVLKAIEESSNTPFQPIARETRDVAE